MDGEFGLFGQLWAENDEVFAASPPELSCGAHPFGETSKYYAPYKHTTMAIVSSVSGGYTKNRDLENPEYWIVQKTQKM